MRGTSQVVVRLNDREWRVRPGEVLRIGRGHNCQVVILDSRISRLHGEVAQRDGVWVYRSVGSNGTFQDGHRLPEITQLDRVARLLLADPDDGIEIHIEAATSGSPRGEVHVERRRQVVLGTSPPAPSDNEDQPSDDSVLINPAGLTTIGRAADNDVVLSDIQASRYHAVLKKTSHGYAIENLGSMNGIQVNGVSVEDSALTRGDTITIGTTRLRFDGELLTVATSDPRTQSVICQEVSFALPDGRLLLEQVNFVVPPASLVAVIGPSGAGKSTLLTVMTGARRASGGAVYFDQREMYANRAEMRKRVGLVPQEDVVHRLLSVRQALDYAAELRFPPDLGTDARAERVNEVLEELSLQEHASTRIDRLSGGQRKRASVSLELLTKPSLLFLDEPTSGLDPGLDAQVMATLRRLADGGRTVVVVTHSVDNLDQCDRVLLLAPGGKVAYYGPPSELLPHFNRDRYADVFIDVAREPDTHRDRFAQSPLGHASTPQTPVPPAARANAPSAAQPAASGRRSARQQLSTLLRRQLRIIAADPMYAVAVVVLPAVLGMLTWLVPGDLGMASPTGAPDPLGSSEARQVLILVIIGACFMGMGLSIRELVSERAIFGRERDVGLSPAIYLAGKLMVYAILVILQAVILVLVTIIMKEPPTNSALLPSGTVELIAASALCAFAAATLGLAFSALVRTPEQVMPIFVLAIMAQLVLSGGLFTVDRPVLEQVAWLSPSRWGFAAAASTVNLQAHSPPGAVAPDQLWDPTAGAWGLAIGMLGVLSVGYALLCLLLLRRRQT
nr:ATP-binding cassette domain-containing protein [Ornithinimicrobium cryptoxanthini]